MGTPKKIPNAKLTREQVDSILQRVAAGEKIRDIAREYEVDPSTIYRAANGSTWTEKPEEPEELKPRILPIIKTISLSCGGKMVLTLTADIFALNGSEAWLLSEISAAIKSYEEQIG